MSLLDFVDFYEVDVFNVPFNLRFYFQDCKDIVILHIGYLSYPNYVITLHMYGLDSIKYTIKDIQFVVSLVVIHSSTYGGWFRA